MVLAADICLRYKLNTQWCGSEKSRFVSKGKIYIFIMCHFNLLPLDNKVIRTGNHIIYVKFGINKHESIVLVFYKCLFIQNDTRKIK